MSPHAVPRPIPRSKVTPELKMFSVTSNAFLPEEGPLKVLPNSYYEPWELIVQHLPILIESGVLRRSIDELPVLSTVHLTTEAEWRRAYVILAFLTHAYVWGGDKPSEVRPSSYTTHEQN